jgi:hypothetical protein
MLVRGIGLYPSTFKRCPPDARNLVLIDLGKINYSGKKLEVVECWRGIIETPILGNDVITGLKIFHFIRSEDLHLQARKLYPYMTLFSNNGPYLSTFF